MARLDPHVAAHLEWIGFVRPTGLVVSGPALVRAGVILDARDVEGHRLLRDAIVEEKPDGHLNNRNAVPFLPDFQTFASSVLGWSFSAKGFAGTAERPIPAALELHLPDHVETLRPTFAVREIEPQEGRPEWQLLVQVIDKGQDFDQIVRGQGQLEASPHGRLERLLRKTGVLAGLLFNGHAMRLISAPSGENSGWLDFRVADMAQTAGRPICSALRLLLNQPALLTRPRHSRLTALLEDSRKFQNEVSERLAEQVLHALYELLRGFQAAHDASKGELLRRPLNEHPDEVYRSLLTVILRIVFLLFAEERDMLPEDETFLRHYSLAGLYERLREEAALFPDTMDQRFGAWSQLLVLFRMIFDGAEYGGTRLPKRHGVLFDPDRFPFLEGRTSGGAMQITDRLEAPLVPDGAIYRVLENLLVLDGERISYRALDVEQIGSVYETMMGFRLETARGRSIAIRPKKKHGAPAAINLEELLSEPAEKRRKWIQDNAGRDLTDRVKKAVKEAATIADLHAALNPVVDQFATPDLVPQGAMLLQPSEERRKSGSHYTPRVLTEPIVRIALEPIFRNLRGPEDRPPRPEQILDLKVCDPAMGSGAFLVETCRQLGDALVEAWAAYGEHPDVPTDEDERIFARRLVAQRCLYGVDRNPVAVDLSKVSLWLVTLAKDHALTFVDHALRHGDSLVGLSRKQIEAFHWDPDAPRFQAGFEAMRIREHVAKVSELRQKIRLADETVPDWERRDLWDQAQFELSRIRLFGDLVLAAFFEEQTAKDREGKRKQFAEQVAGGQADQHRRRLEDWRHDDPPLCPFHWELEFPEVFDRDNSGFDSIVGNPPFAGKNTTANGNVIAYPDWLKDLHAESHGNADLVAHFFRRGFHLNRLNGTLGLIATNTIAQGDTRSSGLRWICQHGGEIYCARRRVKWPGMAAVVVSVLHAIKGRYVGIKKIDDREVETITAFLFHRGGHGDPARLAANAGKSFQGSIVLGMGFTFDDTDSKGVASSLAEMHRLIEGNPQNQEVILPYIGGEELNTSATHAHHRFVINFGERTEEECRERWPGLMKIVEAKVRSERMAQNDRGAKETWWQFIRPRPELHAAIARLERVLVIARVGQHAAVTFLPGDMVFSEQLIVFPLAANSAFCALQSRPHEIWARFFGSSLEDRLRYTPSDCFETFPFPESWETHPQLEAAGKTCYEFRAALMIRNNEGLTKTYNRFHDPDERDSVIVTLRELHAAMDRAVLDAHGWTDIKTDCEFLLDYEIDEDEWGDKKKPFRYRWPDDVRDEVLARLLELNAERAKQETLSGASAEKRPAKSKKTNRSKPAEDLFS
ncbi:MAG TPA: DNA methyltransferase [Terriglobia bacterium]|nr:DNA methyltransferase [Terriglobia bacterium]